MTKIDEAVEAGLYAAHESVFESLPAMVAAFHRALRERGCVVVPAEPTAEMQVAMHKAIVDGITINDDSMRSMRHAYRAMLEAVK